MRVTVAMCTHNPDDASIRRAFDGIASQAGIADADVLVVDNNSSPALRRRDIWLDYPSFRVVEQPIPGLTAAREMVFAEALGDIIVFVDDDNVLGPGYLAAAVQAFESDAQLGVLGGSIDAEYNAPPPAWTRDFEGNLAVRRYAPDFRAEVTSPPWNEHFPIGAGLVIRSELARDYQRDCAATSRIEGRRGTALSSGEDIDIDLFVLSQGFKLAVDGRLRLLHLIPPNRLTVEYLGRLAESNVRSLAELEAKWRPRLGHSIDPNFHEPSVVLCMRAVVTRALAIRSPKYAVKHRRQVALLRLRAGQ